ncbi:MAG: EAL domain-containing protein [Anaerotignum sp.]
MIRPKGTNYTRNIKLLIGGLILCVMVLLLSATFLFRVISTNVDNGLRDREYKNEVISLMDLSEHQLYLVSNYVVTGEQKYLYDYTYESDFKKERDESLRELFNLGVTQDEIDLIIKAVEVTVKTEEIDKNAIAYMKNGETEKARKLIFSTEYDRNRENLHTTLTKLKEIIHIRISEANSLIFDKARVVFIMISLVSVATSCIAVFVLISFLKLREWTNFDELTGLQNRNAYKEKIQKLIKDKPDNFGALIFCDIDNLKFINDCYGHDNGDRYIQALANNLKLFEKYPSVIARLSGDEFVIYIHGFNTKEEATSVAVLGIETIKKSYFITTLRVEEKIRFSTGISIYPIDSRYIEELIKFADYAMFKMKKTSRGEIAFYDKVAFENSTYLLANRGYLDELLEKELIDFALQPIVDANTLEVYGYEALMRPQTDMIGTPYLLLQLGKDESKLDKIEKLVLKKVFEKIDANFDVLKDYKIFINSISNQVLSEYELDVYIAQYPNIFKNIVLEITEQEYVDEEVLKRKTDMFRACGALIALDDYGSGYSNEFTLLSQSFEIIKIDMKLIRNIDLDTKRQELLQSILKIAKVNDYKVVAEGVETVEEAMVLITLGVDYLQGYLLGKPNLQIQGVDESVVQKLKSMRQG